VPENLPPPQEPYDFGTHALQKDSDRAPTACWVCRRAAAMASLRKGDTSIALLVDFSAPALRKLGRDAKWRRAERGFERPDRRARGLPARRDRRLAHGVARGRVDEGKPVELRGSCGSGKSDLSETWSYLLPPN